jgi:alpha-L-rhamnosidase
MSTPTKGAGQIHAVDLLCNDLTDPLGVESSRPLLSWIASGAAASEGGAAHPGAAETGSRGLRQTGYRIIASADPNHLAAGTGDLWDSGWVDSDRCIHVAWAGPVLASRQTVHWAVALRDQDGKEGAWSAAARWEMGLLDPRDWKARWIAADTRSRADPPSEQPAPFFRRAFTLGSAPVRARAYVCGLGWHELYVNGRKAGDDELAPAFTRYDVRSLYIVRDVTDSLRVGENVVGAVLGTGWYDHTAVDVWDFKQAPWRDQTKLIVQLHVECADGTETVVCTDPTWTWSFGPIVSDALRNGEVYDARRDLAGWSGPGYDASAWHRVCLARSPGGRLSSQQMTPIRVSETIVPKSLAQPAPGVWVWHLGRNISGRARIRVRGGAGARVALRFSEKVFDTGGIDRSGIDSMVKSGEFQADAYHPRGDGTVEQWEPRFSYHGFQYVEARGWPGAPSLSDLDGRAVHTDFANRGEFACSSDLVNAIHEASRRSMLYNYHGFPTDCPHRERNGWTGDAQLSAEQALLNFDMDSAYRKWMTDFRDCQRWSGQLPAIVPTGGWGFRFGSGPAWDSAAILIPWYMYVYRGDAEILSEHYDCMTRYLDFLGTMAHEGIVDFGLGDWCPPDWVPSVLWKPTYKCPSSLTDTAYYHVDARLLSAIAIILGKNDDAERYAALADEVRDAFRSRFMDPSTGEVTGDCQTSYSCALYQGLVKPSELDDVRRRMIACVEAADRHIDAGILGAKYIVRELASAGRPDLAYQMITQTTYPGWGEWILRGATTLWETWKGDCSRNHHMYSDVSAWFYECLAGLAADEAGPGFRHFTVTPNPVGGLAWVKARHRSPYGWIGISWKADRGAFTLDLTVPVGATATVRLPAGPGAVVTESGAPAARSPGVVSVGTVRDGRVAVVVGSGRYTLAAGAR